MDEPQCTYMFRSGNRCELVLGHSSPHETSYREDDSEPRAHISFGVTVERHSKGTNFSLRIDGAETEDELMSRAVALWDKLEYRFGAKGE